VTNGKLNLDFINFSLDLEVSVQNFGSSKVEIGKEIALICRISYYSLPTYRWYRDGQLVAGHTQQSLILNADSKSEGDYKCQISINGKSKISENSVYIEVNCMFIKPFCSHKYSWTTFQQPSSLNSNKAVSFEILDMFEKL